MCLVCKTFSSRVMTKVGIVKSCIPSVWHVTRLVIGGVDLYVSRVRHSNQLHCLSTSYNHTKVPLYWLHRVFLTSKTIISS